MKYPQFGLAIFFGVTLVIAGCGDECSDYSDFSCKQIEKATYNVYFYFPDDREYFVGVADGLDQCGSIAYRYATSKNLTRNQDWSYICCMKAKGSDCYEKHR
jgi:hypothetical protein